MAGAVALAALVEARLQPVADKLTVALELADKVVMVDTATVVLFGMVPAEAEKALLAVTVQDTVTATAEAAQTTTTEQAQT
jgi:hypothetical protein